MSSVMHMRVFCLFLPLPSPHFALVPYLLAVLKHTAHAKGGNSIPLRRKRDAAPSGATLPSGDGAATEEQAVTPGAAEDRAATIKHQANVKMKQQVGLPSGVAFIVGTMIGGWHFTSGDGITSKVRSVGRIKVKSTTSHWLD